MSRTINLNIDFLPPGRPSISQPEDASQFGSSEIQVRGTAEGKIKALINIDDDTATDTVYLGNSNQANLVRLFLNNNQLGNVIVVGSNNTFKQTINIPAPGGVLTAKVVTVLGTESDLSPPHQVTIDQQGPEITSVTYNGHAFTDHIHIDQSGNVNVSSDDAIRIGLALDGSILATDTNASDGFVFPLQVQMLADGAHSVTLSAYDNFDNVTVVNIPFTFTLSAPSSPVLTSPESEFVTNLSQITVTGTTEPSAAVNLLVNNTVKLDSITASTDGNFQASVSLDEGINNITAIASNRGGQSPASAVLTVTQDLTIPIAPELTVVTSEGGEVQLAWNTISADPEVIGYEVYRSSQSFTDPENSSQLTPAGFTSNSYIDLPDSEGAYYYRVVAVNSIGTLSSLSNEVHVTIDTTPPKILSINYQTEGAVDQTGSRFGLGLVAVELELSEAVLTTPFFSLTPNLGAPISISLEKISDTIYRGTFEIKTTTPSGIAYAVFSARDIHGNRGTQIEQGNAIFIDTDAPEVIAIQVIPETPIRNDADSAQVVSAIFELNESVKANLQPIISFKLTSTGEQLTPVEQLELVQERQWKTSFTLPTTAGQSESETLSFVFDAEDALGNAGSKITAENAFQVYQGDLPPLDFPQNLTGVSQPDNKIELSWKAVPEASGYQLFRKAPDEAELTSFIRTGNVTSLTDQVSLDGDYQYAIATIRSVNGEESESISSPAIDIIADSTAPAQPQNVQLELTSQGIVATWETVTDTEDVTYRLYRSALEQISAVVGMTPVLKDINGLTALDVSPSQDEHAYAVTAVDQAGNESEPSTSVYLNFALLPVASFNVVQVDEEKPVLTWNHASPTSIDGYKMQIEAEGVAEPVEINQLTMTNYTDTGYTSGERTYKLTAYDPNNVNSLERILTLPSLSMMLNDGTELSRGILNRLVYTVENRGSTSLENAELEVSVKEHNSKSKVFSVAPGASQVVEVVLPGYEDLDPVSNLDTTVRIKADETSYVEVVRTHELMVSDTTLTATLATREFTRGATGQVQLSLINSSDVDIELVTGLAGGSKASPDIAFKLLDEEGNVLATQSFSQFSGTHIITLADGSSVARIPAGGTFTSSWFSVQVPSSAPDNIKANLQISKLHYNYSKSNAENIKVDIQARQDVSLIDTSYYGTIVAVSPESSFGDAPVVIAGQAIDRNSSLAEAVAPLKLVIKANGFERIIDVTTDAGGNFRYEFVPLIGESGQYQVSVIHPDMYERPQQGQFSISNVLFNVSNFDLRMPRQLDKSIPLEIKTGNSTELNGLTLEYKAGDQPTGELAAGVNVTVGDIPDLQSNQSINVPLSIQGTETADDTGSLVLVLRSTATGSEILSTVTVNYTFSEATPFLAYEPVQLNTGVVFDSTVSEEIVIENKGLVVLEKIQLDVLAKNGTAAPAWVTLMSSRTIDSLDVGQKYTAQLQAAPNVTVEEGVHEFVLRASSANFETVDIPFSIAVTQSGIGDVLFKVSDIYTATLDDEGNPIQGVSNARIKLINENVITIEKSLNTDNTGEALFQDIPAGTYQYRISADNHEDKTGQIQVKPSVTASESVFLEYQLITVEWSVNEVTLNDNYEIVLEATYETDVPAAVVVINPSSTTLPDLQKGDVYNGEFTVTNHGLIRADDVKVEMPANDQFFDFELFGGIPDTLDAKQSITVPYRAVMKQSFTSDGSGSGGGCTVYSSCGGASASSICANGSSSKTRSPYCVTRRYGSCTGSPSTDVIVDTGSSSSYNNSSYSVGDGGFTQPSSKGSRMVICRGNNDCAGSGNGAN